MADLKNYGYVKTVQNVRIQTFVRKLREIES